MNTTQELNKILKEIERIKKDYPNHTEPWYKERIPDYKELKSQILGFKIKAQEVLKFLEETDRFYGIEDKLIDLHYKLEEQIKTLKNEIKLCEEALK